MNWIRNAMQRRRIEKAVAEDIEAHLEEKIADLVESGVPDREARLTARREFGNVLLVAETSREVWGGPGWSGSPRTCGTAPARAHAGADLRVLWRARARAHLHRTLRQHGLRRRAPVPKRLVFASPWEPCKPIVVRMVLRESLTVAALGLVIGIPLTLALSRLTATFLFGVKPNDPLVLAAAILTMFAVCALAGYLPARHAARVDPMIALRYE